MMEDEICQRESAATMELRHVPLAARPQGYISRASRWKGPADDFASAPVRPSREVARCLMSGREGAARTRIGGADHILRRDRDRIGGRARHVLHHLVAARLEATD